MHVQWTQHMSCACMEQAMASVLAEARGGAAGRGREGGEPLPWRHVQLAVEAAVNCSSATRHTALHLAAAFGRHSDLQVRH